MTLRATLASVAPVAAAVAALACVALACAPRRSGPPAGKPTMAQFVGNDACAPCHKAEFEKHRKSRHALSLRPATVAELGRLAPPPGPAGDSGCTVRREGDRLYLKTPATGAEIRLDLAVGSGKTGITFVGVGEDGSVDEGRVSYFPEKRLWYPTPGQEYHDGDSPATNHGQTGSRKCLGCHSVALPERGLQVERRFFGIGCETCHGPGSEHIAAAQRKEPDLRMEKLGGHGAAGLNEACGKCHRSPADVGNVGIEMTLTNRFQTFGLMESPCFQKSGDKLSCISCHDPHDDASTDPKDYEAVCQACHEPGSKAACPVNPKEKCVACHMPDRAVFPKSQVPISMADHRIWAYGRRLHR